MKIAKSLLLLAMLSFTLNIGATGKHTFEVKDGNFVYDSKPIRIVSGEMNYSRIPKEYWRHRLKMAKAMGLNAVATYVFWNYHNTAPGVWDFKTESRDLATYIKTAQEEGLMVILRPGPYVCAEWEFGGYPWWLPKEKELVIRTNNQPFLDSCKVYIQKLAEQVRPLQITNGGPIIMVQVENEFGSYVSQRKDIPMEEHKKYNRAIKKMLEDAGFNVPFFTSDGSWVFEGGSIEGALPTANGEGNVETLKKVVNQYHGNKGPYMVAEFYTGWIDHWKEKFNKRTADNLIAQTKKYLDNDVKINFFMIHGGTNFGFTSGANYNKKKDIQPDITSYDYDAPVSEAGWATPKYIAMRDYLKTKVDYKVPEIPAQIPVITIPEIRLQPSVSVEEIKEKVEPVEGQVPMTFEELNQGYGYVLYSRHFNQGVAGVLSIKGLRDYATVYVDGQKVGVLDRSDNNYELDIEIPFSSTLDILVENMGRINYGAQITENNKGIISPVYINDYEIEGDWKMYKLPFEAPMDIQKKATTAQEGVATVYTGEFELEKTGDTFLDMSKWGKGIVFVNGKNLGRYWHVGPQQTLYLPGCWLKKGKNEIQVFEQLNDNIDPKISGIDTPILENLKIENSAN